MLGFDFGNSPSALAGTDLAGRNVVISTAAGVRGFHLFRRVRRLYAASLVCAAATAEAIHHAGSDETSTMLLTMEEACFSAMLLSTLLGGRSILDSLKMNVRAREARMRRATFVHSRLKTDSALNGLTVPGSARIGKKQALENPRGGRTDIPAYWSGHPQAFGCE